MVDGYRDFKTSDQDFILIEFFNPASVEKLHPLQIHTVIPDRTRSPIIREVLIAEKQMAFMPLTITFAVIDIFPPPDNHFRRYVFDYRMFEH